MAQRIRTIKPEFWSHRVMGKIDDTSRCVALALLNFADDAGYFSADPILVRNFCRPFDDDSTITKRSLAVLEKAGWIEVSVTKQDGDIGRIVNFLSHQKIDKPSPSRISKYFDSTSIRRAFDEHSTGDRKGSEGIMEGKGTEQAHTPELQKQKENFNPDATDDFDPMADDLLDIVRQAFQSRNPVWPNNEKQYAAIKTLMKAFTDQADVDGLTPDQTALTLIERFWTLKQSGRDFFRKQPFEPARMLSIWGDILAESTTPADDTAATAAEAERLYQASKAAKAASQPQGVTA